MKTRDCTLTLGRLNSRLRVGWSLKIDSNKLESSTKVNPYDTQFWGRSSALEPYIFDWNSSSKQFFKTKQEGKISVLNKVHFGRKLVFQNKVYFPMRKKKCSLSKKSCFSIEYSNQQRSWAKVDKEARG